MKRFLPLIVIILFWIAMLGRSVIDSIARFNSETISTTEVRVIDADTQSPISGATLKLVCTGGTKLENAAFRSDAQGIAKVKYFESSPIIALNLSKSGYMPTTLAFEKTNTHQITMRKLREQ